jgi:hypothetical protein
MPEVRKADPTLRRRAVLAVALGAVVGALLIAAFDRYAGPLRDWISSQPSGAPGRGMLALLLGAMLLAAPLLVFAARLWSIGASVLRAGEFPPPGHRVIRDTPVVEGRAAVLRGRVFLALAIVLVVISALLWLQISRLARTLGAGG